MPRRANSSGERGGGARTSRGGGAGAAPAPADVLVGAACGLAARLGDALALDLDGRAAGNEHGPARVRLDDAELAVDAAHEGRAHLVALRDGQALQDACG